MIAEAAETGRGVVSYQVVQEFLNVALRRFAKPLTIAEAEQFFVTVLKPLLAVYSSPALFLEGLRIAGRYKLHWYDALIVAAALEAKCAVLYSEDLQAGQSIEGVRVENPFRA